MGTMSAGRRTGAWPTASGPPSRAESRLSRPFDLQRLLQGRSERRVRIADMIGRRGRYVELLSPRGTDDFTMASANALLCWGFRTLVVE